MSSHKLNMPNLNLYCLSFKYYKLVDKLPSYIKALGLGNEEYPEHWLCEKNGKNIANLNKYYGQYTGIYWLWKNQLEGMADDDWIGTCEYRKLWLNDHYNKKQKFSISSLYSNLLKTDNKIFSSCNVVLVQPIIFKNETIYQQFNKVHKGNILDNCINFLEINEREKFKKYLYGNKLCITIFITKVNLFKKFCEVGFPLLKKYYDFCMKNNLCYDYNLRLPAYLLERYASYWFQKNNKTKYLSHARMGKFMISNKINKYINPIKIPFTFRMYPTIHDY